MQRIEVNVITGEQKIIDLTPEEIAALPAPQDPPPPPIDLVALVQQQQALIARLQADVATLKGTQP